MSSEFRTPVARRADWSVALALGGAAFALYLATMAGYVFPGESAHLAAVWHGLDTASFNQYPLFAFFARLFGGGNLVAPVAGAVAVATLYHLVSFALRERVSVESAADASAQRLGAVAGVAAALVFLFTPCVWSAFTHIEPRGFDFAWALLAFALVVPMARGGRALAVASAFGSGVMGGLGLADTPMFLFLFPLAAFTVWSVFRRRGESPYGPVTLFLFAFLVAFFVYAPLATGDFAAFAEAHKRLAKLYFTLDGWILVAAFATVPFLLALLAGRRAFNEEGGWMTWFFHSALTVAAILAVATPFAPHMLMERFGLLPVAASGFVAWTCGYLAAYWWSQVKCLVSGVNESLDTSLSRAVGRPLACVVGGAFATVVAIAVVLGVFTFDRDRGAFADEVARKVIADMGERTWIVTDGTLDDHLRFAAEYGFAEKRTIHLVCLQRDDDRGYLAALAETVKAEGVGGKRNADLVLSLSLGVLPFVQDWLSADPAGAASALVVYGAPDLWYGAGLKAVPEFLFFGGDPARKPDDAAWKTFDALLEAPAGWGSYQLWKTKDPVVKMRLDLRRHVGFVANDRAVWLQDQGKDEEAFALYERVLGEIDADNVCALFNEFEMASAGHPKAAAKMNVLKTRLAAIVEDKGRRYNLLPLGNYYGYIRNAEIFIKQGLAWARSGRPGEALQQVRRAIDFIPTENRGSVMNMMAALYASENDQRMSRELYQKVLDGDAENHDALLGLMRLELVDGNVEKAKEYLRRATEAAGDDPRATVEVAMLDLMEGNLPEAKKSLRKATDADRSNLQAWSLLAAVVMQQIDAAKDDRERAALKRELKDEILVAMEKQAGDRGDYQLQTTRAFVLLHDGEENRREARDAFVAAARDRPDIGATSDIVLGLDISLNDTADAERQAREVLRRNRKAPLANYVMGSLALQRGEYAEAEAFLRRSADAPKPVTLALNDLAEVLRRAKNYGEAERYARRAVAADPGLYVAWETLGSILLDAKGDLDEAERCVSKACELSKGKDGKEADVRMLVSLARVQIARGETARGKGTFRQVQARIGELSEFERAEFEELRKSAR